MTATFPYVGVLVEVTSYSMAKGLVLVTEGTTSIVTYGNLAVITDAEDKGRYLATVVDVREKGTLPSVDHKALQQIYNSIASRGSVDLKKVSEALREIVFPGVHRQYGLREIDLRILGELKSSGSARTRLVLEPHKRPPRPYSLIQEADADTVNKLTAYDCRFMVLGYHLVVNGALVTLDPQGLDTHLAIVGQTGSGKTETVKRVALEYLARTPAPKSLLILDVAGEYLGYPYTPRQRGATYPIPLFPAILDPANYTCEPRPQCRNLRPVPPSKTSIMVPYNVQRAGLRRRDEEKYFTSRYPPLIDYLENQLSRQKRRLTTVLFGRHSVYSLDPGQQLSEISVVEAWTRINKAGDLLIATPPPDALTVDEILEFSGTRSEYAPIAIVNATHSLGILQGDMVVGVNLLSSLLSIYDYVARQVGSRHVSRAFRELGSEITNNLNKIASGAASLNKSLSSGVIKQIVENSIIMIINKLTNRKVANLPHSVYINGPAWWYYATIPLWQWWDPATLRKLGVRRPFDILNPSTIQAALNSQDPDYPGLTWSQSFPSRLEEFAESLSHYSEATRASVIRAVRKVSFLTSPILYYEIYKDVIARMLREEFSLVLLAPPSTGGTDLPVARLLQATFNEAMAQYNPQSRKNTLLIVEEAHNLAPADDEPITKPYIVQIAREGRKWGLGLVIVTQRPGFVEADVLSQAATLIALRVTNPDDISSLRRSVESTSKEIAERLPDLDRGQALVSGMALPERRIPLMVDIRMIGSKC